MEEKEIKTSIGQRIAIIAVAVVMLGSIIAGYAAIVINGSKDTDVASDGSISEAKLARYESEYEEKKAEFQELTASDYKKFISHKDQIKEYNEASANTSGVATKDLEKGSGKELKEGDYDYLAYYVGWCADGTIFDSSLDNAADPTGFASALNAAGGLIEGWNAGVVGMKLGGIRVMTIPGELAYADQTEICGGYNKPLRFMVMAVENSGELKSLAAEVSEAYLKVQYGQYGIDYEALQ